MELSNRAANAPRRRVNFNLHPHLEDPVQRLLNAIEPGSYVRPHRHATPPRWELFVILSGVLAVLIFDDAGVVIERIELDAGGTVRVIEVPAAAWHTVVALQPETVVIEFKQGPYAPLSDKDFVSWAPGDDGPAAQAMISRFATAPVGTRLSG